MLGRGRFASPGRTTDRGSDLKLQRWSWRWYNSSLAITLAGEFSFWSQTTAPSYCTCQGNLRWRAVIARDGSSWLGNLIFAGVVNWILLFTLAEESHFHRCSKPNPTLHLSGNFSNLLLQLTGAFCNKKWQIITICLKKWKFITFSWWKVKNRYFFV